MARRVLTHSQFEALRNYEDGRASWVNGGPVMSLVQSGYLELARGHSQADGFYSITTAGRDALVLYRERYKVPV